ncbi:MAG: hypothetical protein AAFY81_11640 [Pseudomonadota bacterium]
MFEFYLLQRVQAIYDAMDEATGERRGATRGEMNAILDAAGMKSVLHARLTRTIGLRNNREAWL